MDIVIKIDEELYNYMQTEEYDECLDKRFDYQIRLAIKNSTPLPKGHGRLIDADAFIKTMEDASKRQNYKELLIDDTLTVDDVFEAVIGSLQNEGLAEGNSPTIIEADKEDKQK